MYEASVVGKRPIWSTTASMLSASSTCQGSRPSFQCSPRSRSSAALESSDDEELLDDELLELLLLELLEDELLLELEELSSAISTTGSESELDELLELLLLDEELLLELLSSSELLEELELLELSS